MATYCNLYWVSGEFIIQRLLRGGSPVVGDSMLLQDNDQCVSVVYVHSRRWNLNGELDIYVDTNHPDET